MNPSGRQQQDLYTSEFERLLGMSHDDRGKPETEDRALWTYLLGARAHPAQPEVPRYVQASYNAPSGSGTPPHPNLPYPPEDVYPPRDPRPLMPDPFATSPQPGWGYTVPPPQIPFGIPEAFPPLVVGTDIGHWHHSPSERVSRPSKVAESAPAPGSKSQRSGTRGATRTTATGAPGPSTLMVFDEITHLHEAPPISSCNFGDTLTLGDALKKDFTRMHGDSAKRAFPSNQFVTKMAFWHEFNRDLGSTFHPRRRQVTVGTTRRWVKQQPSMARLAYLVAREMEKYLMECNLRQKPFPYTLDDIVLRRIDLASKGTLRPRLFAYARQARPVRSASAAMC